MSQSHTVRWKRRAFNALGVVFVGLGILGYILPVMPGTVFLILALACFQRGNERFERWLVEHPRLGPPLARWNSSKSVPRSVKWTATFAIAASLSLVFYSFELIWPKILVAAVCAFGLAFIWTRPDA